MSLAQGDTPGAESRVQTLNLGVVRHTLSMVSYAGTPIKSVSSSVTSTGHMGVKGNFYVCDAVCSIDVVDSHSVLCPPLIQIVGQ